MRGTATFDNALEALVDADEKMVKAHELGWLRWDWDAEPEPGPD